ncbi:hypothetical protein [Actinomycetospora aeridis]|uniref:Uncharacterized protein n=1 Tax=Actinomycetospora aeridis TaxID=3129231 RepID=A0ABU8N2Y3_9PSEU
MPFEMWRVVVVRAWRHEAGVAVVLLVGEPGAAVPVRRVATGSIDDACRSLATVLHELTETPTGSTTAD